MLGTGIASAQENVNPDTPPSTIDGAVAVPLDIEQNSFSFPEVQYYLPEFHDGAESDLYNGTNPLFRQPGDRVETKYATRGTATPDSGARSLDTSTGSPKAVDADSVPTNWAPSAADGGTTPAWAQPSGNPATAATATNPAAGVSANPVQTSGFAPDKPQTLAGVVGGALPVPLAGDAAAALGDTAIEQVNDVAADAADGQSSGDGSELVANPLQLSPEEEVEDVVSGDAVQDPTETFSLVGEIAEPVTSAADERVAETDAPLTVDDGTTTLSGSIFEVPTSNPTQVLDNASSNVESAVDSTPDEAEISDGVESAAAEDAMPILEASIAQAFEALVAGGEAAGGYSSIPGGDLTTITDGAADAPLSGDLVEAPADLDARALGDPVPAETLNTGDVTASDVTAPVQSAVQVYDVPGNVLGDSLTNVYTRAPQLTPEETEAANLARGVQIPKSIDSLLESTDLPGLSGLGRLPIQRDTLAPRNLQQAEVAQFPEIPFSTMRGGVPVPSDVLDSVLRTATAKAVQLTAEETEAANLARGVQIAKSIDSLLESTDVPNLTAFEVPAPRGPLSPRVEATIPDAPTVNGVPVPVGQTAGQASDGVNQTAGGVNEVSGGVGQVSGGTGKLARGIGEADLSPSTPPSGQSISTRGVSMTGDALPVTPQFAVDRASDAAALTKMGLPTGSYFEKVSDTTGSDPAGQAERAANTLSDTAASVAPAVPNQHVNLTEERSFSGSLPAEGDAGFGTVPVLKSLIPLGSSGRNLTSTPRLPVTAPAAPAVVPAVPVSQPRAMSSGVPLEDIKLNPTSSYADVPIIPVGQRNFPASALAGLDTRTMFGSLDDTVQFERVK
ncbi:hypothetical protein ACFFQW_44645 [Umezawaea endophytica]|uniref:Uncharacterized protein n=1 Tax=Umezawaea endophytica TaxID=1654476 RepID=A0A9X2VVL2_9PSEU|nr:hypothetical protein [Umezawaea endophytica]MCS7483648.1 hypothetical protein [Umezawaea endophytica]